MAISIKRNQDNIKGKIGYIGIDMHKLSWRITALVEGKKSGNPISLSEVQRIV